MTRAAPGEEYLSYSRQVAHVVVTEDKPLRTATTKIGHITHGYAHVSPLISSNPLTTGINTNPISRTEPKPYGG